MLSWFRLACSLVEVLSLDENSIDRRGLSASVWHRVLKMRRNKS